MSGRKYLTAFIVGSSILGMGITLYYVGNAFKRSGRPNDIPFEKMVILIPIMYGLSNMLNIYLQQGRVDAKYVSVMVGAVMGLLFSFMGRFGLDMPGKIFGIQTNVWRVHPAAILIYAGIFGLVVHPLNTMVGI